MCQPIDEQGVDHIDYVHFQDKLKPRNLPKSIHETMKISQISLASIEQTRFKPYLSLSFNNFFHCCRLLNQR